MPHSPPIARPKSARKTRASSDSARRPSELAQRIADDVDHQDWAATVALGQPAEEQRADRSHRERPEDALRHGGDVACGSRPRWRDTANVKRKKSKASSAQPASDAKNACRWGPVNSPNGVESDMERGTLCVVEPISRFSNTTTWMMRHRHLTIQNLGAKNSSMVIAKDCRTASMPAAPSPMLRMPLRTLETQNTLTKRSAARVNPIWHAAATP
jgi:hypothetical protein